MEHIGLIAEIGLIVGVILLSIGIFKIRKRKAFINKGISTQATLVDIDFDIPSDSGIAGFPTIRFMDETGKEITYKSKEGASGWTKTAGDKVDIVYNPDDPYDLIITESVMGFEPLLITIGILIVIASIIGISFSI